MTLAAKLALLFPFFQLATTLGLLGAAIIYHSWPALALSLFTLYLLPIFLWRLHALFSPLKTGDSDIFNKSYSPWWTCHQLQMLYIAYPFIETTLRLLPGLYSLWLRMWGSHIGKNVHWTPGVQVYDRNLLSIGDNCIIGERATFVAHIISPKNGKGILTIDYNRVEKNAFVGAGTVISSGCLIKEGALLKTGTELFPNSVYGKEGLISGKIRGQNK